MRMSEWLASWVRMLLLRMRETIIYDHLWQVNKHVIYEINSMNDRTMKEMMNENEQLFKDERMNKPTT